MPNSTDFQRHLLTDTDKAAYTKALSFHPKTKTCPNVFITLVFNRKDVARENAQNKLKAFWHRVNEIAFGPGWHVRQDLAPAWFVSEHEDGNFHFHGVARFTKSFDKSLAVKAEKVTDSTDNSSKTILKSARISALWEHYAPAGSVEMRRIDDVAKAVGYVLKDVKTILDTNRIVVSPHFR
ncbi:MAG: hypothetical protein H9535_00540 [Ignavibacteria bacterium]|nr:hypothetical protein [Ignavibacteria bacterium]